MPFVPFLYGSQTGCAKEVAERLCRQAIMKNIPAECCALDDFPLSSYTDVWAVIIVCATTGQGDTPDNMSKTWTKVLRKDCIKFDGIPFAVFGLGDSCYEKFNWVAKMMHNRLVQLGAKPLVHRGLGDEQEASGYEKDLSPWLAQLWPELSAVLPDDVRQGVIASPPQQLLDTQFEVVTVDGATPQPKEHIVCPELKHQVSVLSNERITSEDHFQDVRHITFQFVADEPPVYNPGDVVAIAPSNNKPVVDGMLSRLGWSGDQLVSMRYTEKALSHHKRLNNVTKQETPLHPVVTASADGRAVTVRDLLTYYLDIEGTPRQYFFEVIACFAKDAEEQERLAEFGSPEGAAELHKYCIREKRSYLEVLQDFPSVKGIPMDRLIDTIPCIRPREFSISSAQIANKTQLTITMAVVDFKTPYGRQRTGLCTTWLKDLPLQTQFKVLLKTTGFKLPASPETPIIMIGPGTGVAPFRAFVQHRIAEAEAAKSGDTLKDNQVLFFGCRYSSKDFMYQSEWEDYCARNLLTLYTAFSRDQNYKVYVTTKLREAAIGKQVVELLTDKGAHLYIAGNAKNMPSDVQETICDMLQSHRLMTADAATAFLTSLKRKGRVQLDTWA
eukprot:TRINITY_DN67256_c1_g9_i1.p1 TRINITY_DN67256_c1_g9~~TRINITY_DN67256_c1_g9_i1.p1  ORF type:complete len:613 (-),score=36.04 TRINITY_DN67256_c1_g9_i1:813-2651(-)